MRATRHGGALALAALALLPASAPALQPRLERSGIGRLSNELTLTRWAHARKLAPIRARPSRRSRRLARLRFFTEDGYREVYVVLRRRRDAAGRRWLKLRLPMRPNGRVGWVREPSLAPLHSVTTRLVVDRRRLVATLYRSGRPVWSSPVGVGAAATPTPAGRFWIRERIRNLRGKPLYGPWAFGTSAYSALSEWPGGGVIGIHGTDQPGLIPGRPSHGCIRLPNSAVRRLARLLRVGTPVRIR